MIDDSANYEAIARRDPSLDGVVFVAVRTTGVYCRPVCPARVPRAANIRLFASAAAAERAGYRPCLRCRPETAPFCPAWKGTRTTVERALRLIEAGAVDADGVEKLAARLGVGPRHLSRLFLRHLDASPLEVAQTLRVQRAKRLLDETELSIAEISARAGFPSPRRMSATFARLYGHSPAKLRKRRRTEVAHVAVVNPMDPTPGSSPCTK